MNKQYLIAGLGDYKHQAQELLKFPTQENHSFAPLEIEEETFPDGETYHRLITDVRHKHIILFCGTHNDAHFMQLIDLACACAKLGAQSLSLLIPYFGYSTMERATMTGEVVKAKIRARMLSVIPQSKEGNTILFLDLHADGIPHYLEDDTQGFHVYSEDVITHAIQNLVDFSTTNPQICIGSTDTGRSKWVQSLARRLGVSAVTAQKTRHSGSEVSLDSIDGDFQGKTVVIYDDMIRTGGSLIQAARGYLEHGAKKIVAVTTHGVLPGNALYNILIQKHWTKNLIETIVSTDSIPNVYNIKENLAPTVQDRFQIIPTTALWDQAITTYL